MMLCGLRQGNKVLREAKDVGYHTCRRKISSSTSMPRRNPVSQKGSRFVIYISTLFFWVQAVHRACPQCVLQPRTTKQQQQETNNNINNDNARYEELCTLCYQHTLDPGAVAVKRAATEIGGGGPPSRSGGGGNMPGSTNGGGSFSRLDDGEESGLASPSSAGDRSFGGGSGAFGGSFSSLPSPTNTGRDSSGSFRMSGSGAHTPPGAGSRLSSPRAGGGNSPVHRGKQFFAKHLRM